MLRSTLLDQLAYLLHEVEALEPVIEKVPAEVLEGRPFETDLSIKESYGLLAAADEQVFAPGVRRMVDLSEPGLQEPDDRALARAEPWNTYPMPDLLARVRGARAALLAQLRALPAQAWTRTGRWGAETLDVYGLVYRIAQRDVEQLRATGYRLHESRLTDRVQDLPK